MTTMKGMTSKLLIFLTTCVLVLVHADVGGRENAESYITKEAAKELRNKLSHIKNDGNGEEQQDDYDEILKEIIYSIQSKGSKEQHQKHPTIFYEKKYFDYLPNDISDSDDATSEDLSHEFGKKNIEYNSFEDEQQMAINVDDDVKEKPKSGKRIVKRDVTQQDGDNKARVKRQNFYYVPLNHYNPFPRFHYYYPSQDPFFTDIFNHLSSESRQQSFPVAPPPQQFQQGINPWAPQNNPNLRLHQPYNFYLPAVSPPSPTYLPVGPNRPNNNVPSPPDNQGNRPSGISNDEFDDRISGFESTDDSPIWGAQNLIPKRESGSKVQEKPFQTTQRPFQQNQPRPSPNQIPVDDIFYKPNDDNSEVELEYAPALEEDVMSTTRASIRRPTKNRQKKEASRLL